MGRQKSETDEKHSALTTTLFPFDDEFNAVRMLLVRSKKHLVI